MPIGLKVRRPTGVSNPDACCDTDSDPDIEDPSRPTPSSSASLRPGAGGYFFLGM